MTLTLTFVQNQTSKSHDTNSKKENNFNKLFWSTHPGTTGLPIVCCPFQHSFNFWEMHGICGATQYQGESPVIYAGAEA